MVDAKIEMMHKLLRIFLSQEQFLRLEDVEDRKDYFLFYQLLNFNYKLQMQFISKMHPDLLKDLCQHDILMEETLVEFYLRLKDDEWLVSRLACLEVESKYFVLEQYKEQLFEVLNLNEIVFPTSQKAGLNILNATTKLNQKQRLEKSLSNAHCDIEQFMQYYLEWWVLSENVEEELAFILKYALQEWPAVSADNFLVFCKLFVLLHYQADLSAAFDALKEAVKSSLWQCFEASMSKPSLLQTVPEKILLFLLEELERNGQMDADLKAFLNDLLAQEVFPCLKKCVRRYDLDFSLPAKPELPEALQNALGDLLVP